jgi:hypothetical protein
MRTPIAVSLSPSPVTSLSTSAGRAPRAKRIPNSRVRSKEGNGEHRDAEGEEQNLPVDANASCVGEVDGEFTKERDASDRDSDGSAREGQKRAFDEHLPDEAAALCAKRGAQSVLFATGFSSGLYEVGDIETRYEEYERYCPEERVEAVRRSVKQDGVKRSDFHSDTLVGLWVVACDLEREPVGLRLRRFEGDTRFETGDCHEPMVRPRGVARISGIDWPPEIDSVAIERANPAGMIPTMVEERPWMVTGSALNRRFQ